MGEHADGLARYQVGCRKDTAQVEAPVWVSRAPSPARAAFS